MQEPNIPITQELLSLIAEIDEFKGRWEALKHVSPDRLRSLRKVATIESVASSTRIEGVTLSNKEVEKVLSLAAPNAFNTRDEQEVIGYGETMDLVFQSYEFLRLTENHIRQLHLALLRHSQKDERHRGEYKTLPNHVIAKDEQGNEIGIVFETATPFDTPREMEALVQWTNKATDEKSLHPLLIIAVFVVKFLAIHPFQDGNGRLSRILTTLLLLRAGYVYVPFSSLESIIEENKEAYYKALRRTQTTLKSDSPDWQAWVGFFLRCLKQQKENLAAKLQQEKTVNDAPLPLLSQQIMRVFAVHERLTIAEIAKLTKANQNTLKVRLRELVNAGHILRFGKARATWYCVKRE